MKLGRAVLAAVVILAGAAPPGIALAQQAEIRRSALQRHDLLAAGWEVVQVRFDFAPGATAPPHTQPGDEIVYVIDGTIEYLVDDRPPLRLSAGGVLFIPAGAVRAARNVGGTPAAELATYVVEKHRPLTQ